MMDRARRRLWLPLLLGLVALIGALAYLFRLIGLGEFAVLLAVFGLTFVVESVRFIVRAFLKAYRRR
jgi:hypothetical protein